VTDDELRRLRARVAGFEQENTDLRERLAYAWQEVDYIRRRLLEVKRTLQTGEPGQQPVGVLLPVTAAKLDAAIVRLRDVKPLPLA